MKILEKEKNSWQSLFLWYGVFVFLRFVISLLFTEPLVIPDELTYKSMAYGFYRWQDFFALTPDMVGAPTNVGYILYQLVLSVIFFFQDNFLIIAKLINSLLINAAIFPLYGILRDFLPPKEAILYAALPLLLPSFGYSSFLMVENMYIPLFSLLLFLTYRVFCGAHQCYSILSAVTFSLLCLTKPHALPLLLPLLFGGGFLTYFFMIRAKNRILGRKILTSMGKLLSILLVLVTVGWLLLGENFSRIVSFNLSVAEGIPSQILRIFGSEIFIPADFLTMTAAHIGGFLFLFLLPFLIILWAWIDAFKDQNEKNLALSSLGLFFLVELIFLALFISVFLSPQESFVRLHGRYYSMIFPLLLISFAAFRKQISWTRFRKATLIFSSVITFLAILPGYSLYFKSPVKFMLPVDYPELAWAAFLPDLVVAAMAVLFIFSAIWVVLKKKAGVYILFFALFALVSNYAQTWTFLSLYQPQRLETRQVRHFIADTIRDQDSRVAVFDTGELYKNLTVFWMPYKYTRAATLPKDSLLKRELIPKDTDFIILFGEYTLDFVPVREYRRGHCRILRLSNHQDMIKDFSGVYPDAPGWNWTKKEFTFIPSEPFERMIITLNEWRSYFSESLIIETDQGERTFWLNRGQSKIILPFSSYYRFSLKKTFNPRLLGLNPEDNRDLGVTIRSAVVEFH